MGNEERFRRAAERAKTVAFEAYVQAFGISASWKQRSAALGQTSGALSAAAGMPDPVDTEWVANLSNPQLYGEARPVLVVKDVPASLQSENVGQMITGTTTGYCRLADAVEEGDVLRIEGVHWYVDGSRIVSPPIYRELTLRRE